MLKKPLFLLFFFIAFYSTAQFQKLPYSWSIEAKQLVDNIWEIKAICKVDSAWHIYASNNPKTTGSPTTLNFLKQEGFVLIEPLAEPIPQKRYDDLFEDSVFFHEKVVTFLQQIEVKDGKEFQLLLEVETQACQDNGFCTRPEKEVLKIKIEPSKEQKESSFWIFWAGLIAGLFALLTPCVFPLIPLTVTFFTKQTEKRSSGIFRALIYGLSIVVIYVSLGFAVTTLMGAEALNKLASSAIFNLIFFAILLVFALSFLGLFEITIPGFIVNKVDAKADKGGWIGIFFMAFALALVSFSCTGPLIGTLLVEAAVNAGVKGPLLGMLGFSTALALPFTLFAIFPSWLNSLPKSGGWLNSVKVVLGLLELALALKFLSNADLVYQTKIITREVFVLIWILVFFVIFLYLIGKVKFKHDSKIKKLHPIRIILALLSLSFVIYLLPGLWGGQLKLLSGVMPPTFYKIDWSSNSENDSKDLECPNGLDCYHDLDEALSLSKEQNKPILIDFTGWTCVNCRYMEQNIWSDSVVDSLIRNEFILLSLYVDDRSKLPVKEEVLIGDKTKELITYGDKWAYFEVKEFGEITQPLYVVLDHQKNQLGQKQSYTVNKINYRQFLLDALSEYNKMAK